ncbi:hypothetical protein N9S30_00440, partial [bacterium]|nr:hypothetical protein [bacterium]
MADPSSSDTASTVSVTTVGFPIDQEDDDDDEGGECVETKRMRICRSITPSPPSKTAIDVYSHITRTRAALFKDRGYSQFVPPKRKLPTTMALSSVSSSAITGGVGVGTGQNRRLCMHVLCLKTKSHTWIFSSPAYVFERLSDGAALSAVAQISTVLRDHANAVAFVAKRSVSEQSSQQTTRFPISAIGVAELSQQLVVKTVIGLAAPTPEPSCNNNNNNQFIASSSTSHFAVSSPATLHSFDFLASAVDLAKDEIEFGVISQRVPQTTDHLLVVCRKIVDQFSCNGARIWFSIGLVDYLKREPAVGDLMRSYGFTQFAASISSSLLAYARAVVGNRARREYETLREMDTVSHVPLLMPPQSSSAAVVVDGSVETSLDHAARVKQVEAVKTLSKKRKQSAVVVAQSSPNATSSKVPRKIKDSSTVDFSGAPGVRALEFLQFVFSSNQRSLLLHLISESTTTSESAARTILNWQLQNSEVASDVTLVNTSEACAKSSRLAVMRLLRQREQQSPCISNGVPLLRSSECAPSPSSSAASTVPSTHVVLACRRFTMTESGPLQVFWVTASQRTKTSEVGELMRLLRLKSNRPIHNKIEQLSERPLPIELSGLSRSRIHFNATIPSNATVVQAINTVRRQCTEHSESTPFPIAKETMEPHTTPSNAIAVGLYLSEIVRAGQCQIHSKQTIEAVPLCHKTDAETKTPNITSPRERPWILFGPLDITYHRLTTTEVVPMSMPSGRNDIVELRNVQIQLTMLGDSPVPVTHACKTLLKQFGANADELSFLRQYRSLLLFGGVQAATLSDFATSVGCKEINQQIAGTSKIVDADRHRRLFVTINQAFVVHHTNVAPSFIGTPWEGVYGTFYDSGATASAGTNGASFISDGRRPAPVMMPDAQVDHLTEQIARRVVMKVSTLKFAHVPAEARSIPRCTVPGLHKALNPLCFAFEGVRRLFGITTSTCPSIQVLPMSPFTEAVSCRVGRDVAAAHRTSFAGEQDEQHDCLYRADNTAVDYSILQSKLFESIRCRATQPGDNVFRSIESNCESVVLVLTMVVEISIALSTIVHGDEETTTTRDAMDTLFRQLDLFHTPDGVDTEAVATLCADAVVLLNVCMPLEFAVGEPVIAPQYEAVHNEIAFEGKRDILDRSYWDRLRRNWNPTVDLATALHTYGSSFDHCIDVFQSIATMFEAWTRGIWYVQSLEGTSPPTSGPYSGRASPKHVRSSDVNGVWVDNRQSIDPNCRLQRGAIFGVQPLQLNQVFQAMNAATHIPGIRVQLYRNEGSLLVRPSCYALKRAQSGEKPSAKSISPVQSESTCPLIHTLSHSEFSGFETVCEQVKTTHRRLELATQRRNRRAD